RQGKRRHGERQGQSDQVVARIAALTSRAERSESERRLWNDGGGWERRRLAAGLAPGIVKPSEVVQYNGLGPFSARNHVSHACRHRRPYATRTATAPAGEHVERRARQARGQQSRGIGQGPARIVDDYRSGEARRDQAGRY